MKPDRFRLAKKNQGHYTPLSRIPATSRRDNSDSFRAEIDWVRESEVQKNKTKTQQMEDLIIIISLSCTVPPVLQPALKKQRTLRVFPANPKRWLTELSENNHDFKQSKLAHELEENFSVALLSRSTVSDWLKRDAVKMP